MEKRKYKPPFKPEILEEELCGDGMSYRKLMCPVCNQHGVIYQKDFVRHWDFRRTAIPHPDCKIQNRKDRMREARKRYEEAAKEKGKEVLKHRWSTTSGGKYVQETGTTKNRVCLSCNKMFKSRSNGNRICEGCGKKNRETYYEYRSATLKRSVKRDEQLVHDFNLYG